MAFNWWLIDILIFLLVCLGTECRRRRGHGHRGFINGGPPRRIPPWQADWWARDWIDDEDGLPPEHPWDSHDKDDWDSSLGAPDVPPQDGASMTCTYRDIRGIRIECSMGCCISSRGFGCCETAGKDEDVPDHTQLIIYITLGIIGALFAALIVAVIVWKFCKTNTTTNATRKPKPVNAVRRPVTAVAQVLPANYDMVTPTISGPRANPQHSRTRLPSLDQPHRQPSAPAHSADLSRQQNRSSQRPPANGTSRYDIFTVSSPVPVLPNYSDVTETNRPPPEYSVNEPNFGSGYLRSFMSPPPPYSPNGRTSSTTRQSQNRYSRMSYSNI